MSRDDAIDTGDDPAGGTGRPTGDDGDVRDLLAAYALDAVDDVERRAVERLVERDEDAARELAELRATAAVLGSASSAAAPVALRADVLDRVARTPQVPVRAAAAAASARGAAPPAAPSASSRPRRTTMWLAVAATAIGAAAIPSVLAIQQAQETQRVEAQARAVADLLADPGAVVVRADVTGGGTAVGVLADDRALFTATGLTEPGTGTEYQLWILRDGVALSQGVLPDDAGRVRAVADDYRPGDLLAVTLEPAGGSEQPTTEPVVVLEPAPA